MIFVLRSAIFLFTCLISLSLSLHAQEPVEDAKVFPLLHKETLPPNYFLTRLPNGLQILVIEDRRHPVAHVQARIKLDALEPGTRERSLAHFYEHLIFAANDELYIPGMVTDEFHQHGMIQETGIEQESVYAQLHLPTSEIGDAMNLLSICLQKPKFDDADLEKARKEIVAEISGNESDPVYFLRQDLQKRCWGKLSELRFPDGNYPDIAMSGKRELFDFHTRFVQPQFTLISVAGDVKHKDIFNLVDFEFGGWKVNNSSMRMPQYPSVKKADNPGFFVTENMFVSYPIILASWPGPDLWKDERGALAAQVFVELINNLQSPMLQAVKRTEYAFNCNFTYEGHRALAVVNLALIPEPGKTAHLLDTFLDVMIDLGDDNWFDQEQFETARKRVLYNFRLENESLQAKLTASSRAWANSSVEYFSDFRNGVEDLVPYDIYQFYRRYILGKPITMGATATPEQRLTFKIDSAFTLVSGRIEEGEWRSDMKPEPIIDHESFNAGDSATIGDQMKNYRIFFERDSYRPTKSSREALQMIATYLQNNPNKYIYIDGHTDTRGSAEQNKWISEARADSVRDLLAQSYGVEYYQMIGRGFGEEKPAFMEYSAAQIQANRRVEISVIPEDSLKGFGNQRTDDGGEIEFFDDPEDPDEMPPGDGKSDEKLQKMLDELKKEEGDE